VYELGSAAPTSSLVEHRDHIVGRDRATEPAADALPWVNSSDIVRTLIGRPSEVASNRKSRAQT
jgi:hypothetical protein